MGPFSFMDFLAVAFSGLSLVAFGFVLGCHTMRKHFVEAQQRAEDLQHRYATEDHVLH